MSTGLLSQQKTKTLLAIAAPVLMNPTNLPEPSIHDEIPQIPETKSGTHIFELLKKPYEIAVDYTTKSSCHRYPPVLMHLKSIFAKFGIPLW